MACDWHEIEYWSENNRVRNNDTESKKKSSKLPKLMLKGELY